MKRKISYFLIFSGALLVIYYLSTPKWDYFDAQTSYRSLLVNILGLIGGLLLFLGLLEIVLTAFLNYLDKKKKLPIEKIQSKV